jgi:hypothetical protein
MGKLGVVLRAAGLRRQRKVVLRREQDRGREWVELVPGGVYMLSEVPAGATGMLHALVISKLGGSLGFRSWRYVVGGEVEGNWSELSVAAIQGEEDVTWGSTRTFSEALRAAAEEVARFREYAARRALVGAAAAPATG